MITLGWKKLSEKQYIQSHLSISQTRKRGPCLILRLPGAMLTQGGLDQTARDEASPAAGRGAQDHRKARAGR